MMQKHNPVSLGGNVFTFHYLVSFRQGNPKLGSVQAENRDAAETKVQTHLQYLDLHILDVEVWEPKVKSA